MLLSRSILILLIAGCHRRLHRRRECVEFAEHRCQNRQAVQLVFWGGFGAAGVVGVAGVDDAAVLCAAASAAFAAASSALLNAAAAFLAAASASACAC